MSRGPYAHSDRDLLNRIGRAPGGKAGYKQLIRELGLGGGRERRLLLEQLSRIAARGELVKLSPELWAVPRPAEDANKPRRPARRGGLWDGMEQESRSGRDRLVSGKLDLHRDGFGFVRPDAAKDHPAATGDIFIAPNELNGAMGGDLVLVDEFPPGRDGRRSGRIARVLTRRNPTIVGIFHYARTARRSPGYNESELSTNYVTPLDERIGSSISIPAGEEIVTPKGEDANRTLGDEAKKRKRRLAHEVSPALEGMAVDVEIIRFPQAGRPALGRVIEVLGHPDDFGVDVEIVIRKHHIPHVFPPDVLVEAEDRSKVTPETLEAEELALREDFRELPVVTIDGETAKDFDDAVLVQTLPNGNTELQVHIADVSAYVIPGSPLDTEARVRGNSVYFPDRAVPMLPHALSSGMCSLLPKEDRFVMSCIMEIDAEGEIVRYRVAEGIIRSARRCTYTSVQACLNVGQSHPEHLKPASAEDIAECERVALEQPEMPKRFEDMLELALRLNRKRVRRGSIDFDLPEPLVLFDPDGNMKAIVRTERGWAHRLIEEFMLSANECVATWLASQEIPSIYRIHEMPDPKRIVEFEETAATFGQTLGIGAIPTKKLSMKSDRRSLQARGRNSREAQKRELPEKIPVTPQMYQKLIRRIDGHPEERILSYLMLRSLKQARYAEKNEGHFALASPTYTHFTSPIRRYPDLIVHRLMRSMLRGGASPRGGAIHSGDKQPWSSDEATPQPTDGPITVEELNDIADECSKTERRASDAERELVEWKKMKFMADKVGDDFGGMILSVTKYGFFVELDQLFIEGMVPIATIPEDEWHFRDTDRTIVGVHSGHVFKPGQRVTVILDRIDRVQRRLQFALVDAEVNEDNASEVRPVNPRSPRAYGERKKAEKQKKSTKEHKRAKKAKHAKRGR
ncbi:ribonuclease R family protein [Granulicella cerasi]|uniref:ribonuclease R family protein n=1 Tax=Granulicella cerasi TaxID=741063 RepID=UPI0021E0D491|nr:RNB domain-containing ribonuclease [Granulicella cerasi]